MSKQINSIITEHYIINWHSFKEIAPPMNTQILCKKKREHIKYAHWCIAMDKSLYLSGLRWCTYISKAKNWMWASLDDITRID